MADPHVEVVVEIAGEDVHAGDLWSHRNRGRESATFAYATSYLEREGAYALDPALTLLGGQQHTAEGQAMFAAFADCAPDRWGRTLVKRAEHQLAEEDGRTERSLGEFDYLLGARDDMRQGALRFREPGSDLYLAHPGEGVPSLVRLPELLAASEREELDQGDDSDLALLLNGGSSLGGARPKAHVVDEGGRPMIAKFPAPAADELGGDAMGGGRAAAGTGSWHLGTPLAVDRDLRQGRAAGRAVRP